MREFQVLRQGRRNGYKCKSIFNKITEESSPILRMTHLSNYERHTEQQTSGTIEKLPMAHRSQITLQQQQRY